MSLVPNLKVTNKFPLKNVQFSAIVNTPTSLITHENHPRHVQDRGYSKEPLSVRCKIALILGGVRGVGFQITEGLLDAGTRAVIIGDNQAAECEEAISRLNKKYGEARAFFQHCDITKKCQTDQLFRTAKDVFKRIDFVVNNADIDEKWDRTLCVNLNGLVRGTLLGFQYMGTQNCGRGGFIINVSSILGLQPFFASPVYVGTKHFGIGFTRSMGTDYFYKRSKVKVMAVCPSVTDTLENKKEDLPVFDKLHNELACGLKDLPVQGSDEIGKGLLTMLQDGENGSIWVSEGKEFYKAKIPPRQIMKYKRPFNNKDPCKKPGSCKIEVPDKGDPCAEKQEPLDPCHKDDPCKRKNPCKDEGSKKSGQTSKKKK